MISVISSTINPDTRARASLLSILKGLSENDEIVLHIDPHLGSISSWDPEISDSRLKVLRTSHRLGFALGLNFAAEHARHRLLGRIDMDDLALPFRWKYQYSEIEGVDFHFGSMLHLFSSHSIPKILPHYPVSLNSIEFASISQFTNPGFHPTVLFRRSVFEDLGGYRETLSEDYDLWLRGLASGHSFRRGFRPVTVYRHHKGQATASPEWGKRVSESSEIVTGKHDLAEYLQSQEINPRRVIRKLLIRQPFARTEFREVISQIKLKN